MKESMHVNWVAEDGLVESIKSVVKEYKETRGLIVRPSGGSLHKSHVCHMYVFAYSLSKCVSLVRLLWENRQLWPSCASTTNFIMSRWLMLFRRPWRDM